MSDKKTSGPSKPRDTLPAKRGRSASSRSSTTKPSQTDIETNSEPEAGTVIAAEAKASPRKRTALPNTKKLAESHPVSADTVVETAADKASEPAAKRTRRSKTGAEPAEAAPLSASEDAPKPRRGRPRKVVASTDTGAEEAKKAPKSRARKAAAETKTPATDVALSSEAEATPVETTEPPAPRRRGRPRKSETVSSETEAVPEPKPAARRKSASVATDPVEAPARPRRARKAAVAEVVPEASVPEANSEPVSAPEEAVAPTVPAEPQPTPATPIEVPVEETAPALPLFSELGLAEPIMSAIRDMGYERPTPIQAQAIPQVLAGHDVLGVAQTGTGKTASFTLPMLEKLSGGRARARMPRSLILEPTRELALQVAENFKLYGKNLRLNHALLIGGESMADQREVLNRGVDVLIATPGRLLDLFERGGLLLTQTGTLVIDEADRMLDMGFIPDIERITALLPPRRQTLFFSATMAPEIRKLADAFLRSPVEITVSRPSSVATTIEESLLIVEPDDKKRTLRRLLRAGNVQNAIVFCNRKRDVDMLQSSLSRHGIEAGHLHGDLAQSLRTATLERFRSGELKILVCSDVAARGIDISGLSHVFNYDLPFNAEDYVHRIGRTGRAGNEGHAISLATPRERHLLEAIESLTGKTIATPQIAGIRLVDWASEDDTHASARRNVAPENGPDDAERDEHKRRKRRRGGKKRRDEQRDPSMSQDASLPVTRAATSAEDASQLPVVPLPESNIRPSVELAPAFEDGVKTGFGSDTPAFMLLPRRRKFVADTAENDLSRPVQHDAKHYGEH